MEMVQIDAGQTELIEQAAVVLARTFPWNDEWNTAVSYTHLRAHETVLDLVCRLLLEKKKQKKEERKKTSIDKYNK